MTIFIVCRETPRTGSWGGRRNK